MTLVTPAPWAPLFPPMAKYTSKKTEKLGPALHFSRKRDDKKYDSQSKRRQIKTYRDFKKFLFRFRSYIDVLIIY